MDTDKCKVKFAGSSRLTIKWSGPAIRQLEDELGVLLAKYGLECWAQGYNLETRERDMAFRPVQD